MPYPINQRAQQFNSIQSVPVSFGLWDTALKFPSPGPRSDVTDHLEILFITSLTLQQMSPDETHPGTKYIIQGRRGLAGLLTKTTDQKAGL